MRYLICVLCLMVTSLVYSAPVPRKVPKPVVIPFSQAKFEIKLNLMWQGVNWHMHFDEKGNTFTCQEDNTNKWYGSYSYDPVSRILVVHEKYSRSENNDWMLWQVTLTTRNTGTAVVTNQGNHEVVVKFTVIKETSK